jgi:hypothetical protein
MRTRLVALLVALSAVGGLATTRFAVSPAQAALARAAVDGPLADPDQPDLPPGAVPGSTPERQATWNGATTSDRDQAMAMFQQILTDAQGMA